MNFKEKLISGKLIKRYKRFFVDVKINKKQLLPTAQTQGQCWVY